jgi:ferredoxin/biotin operon repressor
LDSHPSTAPKAKSIDEILRILFTPEEAAIAVNMSYKPKSTASIAEATGVSESDAQKSLESMASKGVIFSRNKDGQKLYGLVALIPGVFEFPFMKGGGTPMHARLAQLWEEYHHDALGSSFAGNPTPLMRVVVAKCDKPKEVCLIFDGMAEFLVERGFARQISKEEGMKVLDQVEGAGLVHMSNNSADRAGLICNCCPCCCTILRGRTQLKHPHAFEPSRFEARVNSEDCTACAICADERCPMKAIEIKDNAAIVNAAECIGCGLCVTGCPTGAIELTERKQVPSIPATTQEMSVKVLQEKGRLDAFMKVMQS